MFLLLLIVNVLGHGRLVKPVPYFGTGTNSGQENEPVSGPSGDDFVCRHTTNTQPLNALTAGQTLNIQWDFSVKHVGDCALYASYDVDAERAAMKWFKIGNFPQCNNQDKQDVPVTIPEWLPAGPMVMRWDWYALHTYPGAPEFYAQCFGAEITATDAAVPKEDIFTYVIPGLYPATISDGVGYRNPTNQNSEQFLTGPPCALNWDGNNCAATACGATGFIDVKNAAATGRRTRRLLCADIKPTTECENAKSTWDICADSYWNAQCQKTCEECSATDPTNNPNDPTTTAAGCEAYTYDFNNQDNGNQDGEDNGNETTGNPQETTEGSSSVLSLTLLLISLLVFV